MLALSLLSKVGGFALSLLGRSPPVAWLVIALAAWGFYGAHQAQRVRDEKAHASLVAAQAQTTAANAARAREQALNKTNMEIANALQVAQAGRTSASRLAAQRLHDLATASNTRLDAVATCRGYAGPAVAVIPDATRDALVQFATDADAVADQLRACQAWVRGVAEGSR